MIASSPIRIVLLLVSCVWGCAQIALAQQEFILDGQGPRVTLGVPQPIHAPVGAHGTISSAAAGRASNGARPAPAEAVRLRPLAPPRSEAARLISEGASIVDLALPTELLEAAGQAETQPAPSAVSSAVPQLRSLPPLPGQGAPRQAAPGQATSADEVLPAPVQPQAKSAVTERSLEELSLEAVPAELVPAVPNAPAGAPVNGPPSGPLANPPASVLATPGTAGVPESANSSSSNNSSAASTGPTFFLPMGVALPPGVDQQAWHVPYSSDAFCPPPIAPLPLDPYLELSPYRGKAPVPVQRPWVELWRPLYTGGIYPPAKEWFGRYNPVMPHFMVYGDYRTGIGINRNAAGDLHNWAQRLNLDMDLELTATERIHAFMGPLDRAGDFTRLEFQDEVDYVNRMDMRLDNLFFEGDAGAIWGGWTDQDAPFDLPFAVGYLPVFYQNGIWAADNVIGAAVAIPSRNSALLGWSNYDATFFWASDQINSDAFPGDNNAAEFVGTAWFIEAYDGYVEANYAYVHDDVVSPRSYHNLSLAFSKRYFHRVSNAIRCIVNLGQDLPQDQRTADGHLILIENSLISKAPNTFVPYMNLFYGQGRTQSLARANIAGGVLNNTGINFENDGLTGYPTLDATGVNATGAAVGLNMLGADFQHQLILELAGLTAYGQPQFRNAAGDEYAVGMRYQKPLSNAWIFRTDHMYGWRESTRDLHGSRVELRWKF